MSNVDTTAERTPCDLTHFIYSTGSIGHLKTLAWIPVVAGDSFEAHHVGAFGLAPFRRGLSVDANLDIFTFYIPHRHTYGQSFVDIMKTGMPDAGQGDLLATDAVAATTPTLSTREKTAFLGTHYSEHKNTIPKFLYQAYLNIYNHYFKIPFMPDITTPLASLGEKHLRDGFETQHLETIWSRSFNPNADREKKFADMAGNDGIDIIGLNAAYAKLHTQQERDHFMQRYRDVVSSFGGSTHYDADVRPHLLMRTNQWCSGYDNEGSTQETLGQYAGRTRQSFSHRIPRFYVPEHGVIMTLALCRFPPIHMSEMHGIIGQSDLDYQTLAVDPALIANAPLTQIPYRYLFQGYTGSATLLTAPGQVYRFHPNYVDFRYRQLKGFPFIDNMPPATAPVSENFSTILNTQYDQCFQTTQLGHWNIQSKYNCNIMRHIPSARDGIMTN